MDLEKELMKYKEESNRRFNRLEELFAQNGEHFSYFNKNLEGIKSSIDTHIKRVEPMLLSYERDTAFNKTLGEKAKKWGSRLSWGAVAIGSWYVVKQFIITSIIK